MNVEEAAKQTVGQVFDIIRGLEVKRAADGRGLSHAVWMLEGIGLGYIQHEKAHRWLGYSQAIIVELKLLSLEEMKNINLKSDRSYILRKD